MMGPNGEKTMNPQVLSASYEHEHTGVRVHSTPSGGFSFCCVGGGAENFKGAPN